MSWSSSASGGGGSAAAGSVALGSAAFGLLAQSELHRHVSTLQLENARLRDELAAMSRGDSNDRSGVPINSSSPSADSSAGLSGRVRELESEAADLRTRAAAAEAALEQQEAESTRIAHENATLASENQSLRHDAEVAREQRDTLSPLATPVKSAPRSPSAHSVPASPYLARIAELESVLASQRQAHAIELDRYQKRESSVEAARADLLARQQREARADRTEREATHVQHEVDARREELVRLDVQVAERQAVLALNSAHPRPSASAAAPPHPIPTDPSSAALHAQTQTRLLECIAELAEARASLHASQSDALVARTALEAVRAETAALRERARDAETRRALAGDIAEMERALADQLAEERETLKARLADQRVELARATRETEEAREATQAETRALERARSETAAARGQVERLFMAAKELAARNDAARADTTRAQEETARLTRAYEESTARIAVARADADSMENRATHMQHRLETMERDCTNACTELERINGEVARARRNKRANATSKTRDAPATAANASSRRTPSISSVASASATVSPSAAVAASGVSPVSSSSEDAPSIDGPRAREAAAAAAAVFADQRATQETTLARLSGEVRQARVARRAAREDLARLESEAARLRASREADRAAEARAAAVARGARNRARRYAREHTFGDFADAAETEDADSQLEAEAEAQADAEIAAGVTAAERERHRAHIERLEQRISELESSLASSEAEVRKHVSAAAAAAAAAAQAAASAPSESDRAVLSRALADLHSELGTTLASAQAELDAIEKRRDEVRQDVAKEEASLSEARSNLSATTREWRTLAQRVATETATLAPTPSAARATTIKSLGASPVARALVALASPSPHTRKQPSMRTPAPTSPPVGSEENGPEATSDVMTPSSPQIGVSSLSHDITNGIEPDLEVDLADELEVAQLRQRDRDVTRLNTDLLAQSRAGLGAAAYLSAGDSGICLCSRGSSPAAQDLLMPAAAFLTLQDLHATREAHLTARMRAMRHELDKWREEARVLLEDVALSVTGEDGLLSRLARSEATLTSWAGRSDASVRALFSDLLALLTATQTAGRSLEDSLRGFASQLSSLRTTRALVLGAEDDAALRQALVERDAHVLFLRELIRRRRCGEAVLKMLPPSLGGESQERTSLPICSPPQSFSRGGEEKTNGPPPASLASPSRAPLSVAISASPSPSLLTSPPYSASPPFAWQATAAPRTSPPPRATAALALIASPPAVTHAHTYAPSSTMITPTMRAAAARAFAATTAGLRSADADSFDSDPAGNDESAPSAEARTSTHSLRTHVPLHPSSAARHLIAAPLDISVYESALPRSPLALSLQSSATPAPSASHADSDAATARIDANAREMQRSLQRELYALRTPPHADHEASDAASAASHVKRLRFEL